MENLLPQDGMVHYYGKVLDTNLANSFYQKLRDEIFWEADQAIIFGKHYYTARKVAWYGMETFSYTYSGITKTAHLFTDTLLELKKLVEANTGASYNSCLLNLYHTGTESMAWHSDGEKMLENNGSIASLSLGAKRKFSLKHKILKTTISVVLENG